MLLLVCAVFVTAQNTVESPAVDVDEQVFTVVEQSPEFPGGMEAMYQYLSSNIQYPDEAKTKKITGRVLVSFVVEKNGSISDVTVVKCPNELLCKEAVRVIESMPKWKAGRQAGKKVRAKYMLPINFTLNDK